MKILHTSDWHVGKNVRGRDRHNEHAEVLHEIAALADEHQVDVVLVTGDLFDSAAPSARSERVVYEALMALTRPERHVVVIAGNHDHPQRLAAVAPLLDASGVHVLAEVRHPDAGGVIELDTACGQPARVALLPFVHQRHAARSADLMDAALHAQQENYRTRIRRIIEALTAGFDNEAVNILAVHAFVDASSWGGDGERAAHFIEEYAVPAELFPSSASYVALGHVHRCQTIPAAAPTWYCGSPLRLDFGEAAEPKSVLLIQAEPGVRASVSRLQLTAGRDMRTVEGTFEQLSETAATDDSDDWLRVRVRGPLRSGLADDIRTLFGERAVEVRADPPTSSAKPTAQRSGSPIEMFDQYLTERNISDSVVSSLFAELLGAAHTPDEPAPPQGSDEHPTAPPVAAQGSLL